MVKDAIALHGYSRFLSVPFMFLSAWQLQFLKAIVDMIMAISIPWFIIAALPLTVLYRRPLQ